MSDLLACPDCDTKVRSRTAACPNCGRQMRADRVHGRKSQRGLKHCPQSALLKLALVGLLQGCSGGEPNGSDGTTTQGSGGSPEPDHNEAMGGEDANDSSGAGGNDDDVSTGGAESSGGAKSEHSGGTGNDNGGSGGVLETEGTGGSDSTGGTGGTGGITMECEPGDQKCTDIDIEICNEEGQWEVSQSCPFVCNYDQMFGAQCIGVCEPAAEQCSVENYVEVCNEYGQWSPTEICQNACVQGECVGSCEPSDIQCAGDNLQLCDETGTWNLVDTCAFVCSAGSCTGVCEPGSVDCMGDTPRTCNAQGQWVSGSECPFVCSSGSCTGVCEPSTEQCNGNTPRACDESGQWVSGSPCEYVCTGSGNCSGECDPGTTQCDARDLQVCTSEGGWTTNATCQYACVAGSCGGECVPGSGRCEGNTAQVCDSEGVWQDDEACPFACSDGSCEGECVPGVTRCDGDGMQTCGSNGYWEPTTACEGGIAANHTNGTCQDGVCIVACESGYDDCSPLGDGVCESELAKTANHCGVCGHSCGPGSSCQNNMCVPGVYASKVSPSGSIISNIVFDDAGDLYWGESSGVIAKYNGSSTTTVASSQSTPRWVFYDNSKVCWTRGYGTTEGTLTGDLVCRGENGNELVMSLQSGLGRRNFQHRLLDGSLFWLASNKVLRSGSLASGTSTELEVIPLSGPSSGAYFSSLNLWGTDTHVYWFDNTDPAGALKRKVLSTGAVESLTSGFFDYAMGLQVVGDTAFFVDNDGSVARRIIAVDLVTTEMHSIYVSDLQAARLLMLTVEAPYVYWVANSGTGLGIYRYRMTDGAVVRLTEGYMGSLGPDPELHRFTTDDEYLYWVGSDSVNRVKKSHWTDF